MNAIVYCVGYAALLLFTSSCDESCRSESGLVVDSETNDVLGEEIRCYHVGPELLRQALMVYNDPDDPFAVDDEVGEDDWQLSDLDWLGPVVKEAPFESRFLEKAGELRDCSRRVIAMIGPQELKAQAVYDVDAECLIVKANEEAHWLLRLGIERERARMIQVTLSIYQLPGVKQKDQTGFLEKVPEKAKLLHELSWNSISGQSMVIQSDQGALQVESEIQWDAYDGYVGHILNLESTVPQAEFQWATFIAGITGANWIQEIGSLDGENTLFLVSRYDPVFSDGRLWNQWVEKEEGGFFLEEALLQRIRWRDPHGRIPGEGPNDGTRVFSVPPTLETFLMSDYGADPNKDPFAPQEENAAKPQPSMKELLKQNGVEFREGDFAFYRRGSCELYVKLSPENLEILYGIIQPMGTGPPEYPYLEMTEIDGGDFHNGKVLRRAVIPMFFGQIGRMQLGDDFLVEAEMRGDQWDRILELRLSLMKPGKEEDRPILNTALVAKLDQPIMVKSEKSEGKQRTWFAVIRNKVLEEELDAFLKKRDKKR